jgi:hypothetical protein
MKRKVAKLLLVLAILPSTNTLAADKWSTQDKSLEATYLVLKFVDWRQTRYIAKNPDKYYEMNPMLGKHPSTKEVDAYFITTAILHPIVSHYLPKKYRTWWQAITITMSGTCVVNNFAVGIKMDF